MRENGDLDPRLQRGRNCTLPGYGGGWAGDAWVYPWTEWFGRQPMRGVSLRVLQSEGVLRPDLPSEDKSQGCPGGWYRSRFAQSFMRWRRRRVEGGMRVSNIRLGPMSPSLVLEAVEFFEAEEDAAVRRYHETVSNDD